MKTRLLAIALAVSMLFNIAVLIGFVQRRATQTPAPHDAQPSAALTDDQAQQRRVARELQLDQTQSAAFGDLQTRQRQLSSLFSDSVAVIRQDLSAELSKEQPDLDRVRSLVDQEAELVRQRRRAGADLYAEFVDVLSPQQRQRLGQRFAAPPPPIDQKAMPQPGPQSRTQGAQRGLISQELVRRFDRNGNGRLEGDEAQAARRELDRRRREVAPHVPRRPPLWPWFDADDDGQLSESEREKMEAFIRENNISPQEVQPPPLPSAQGRPNRRGDGRGPEGPDARPGGPRPGDHRPDQPPQRGEPPVDAAPGAPIGPTSAKANG